MSAALIFKSQQIFSGLVIISASASRLCSNWLRLVKESDPVRFLSQKNTAELFACTRFCQILSTGFDSRNMILAFCGKALTKLILSNFVSTAKFLSSLKFSLSQISGDLSAMLKISNSDKSSSFLACKI